MLFYNLKIFLSQRCKITTASKLKLRVPGSFSEFLHGIFCDGLVEY